MARMDKGVISLCSTTTKQQSLFLDGVSEVFLGSRGRLQHKFSISMAFVAVGSLRMLFRV